MTEANYYVAARQGFEKFWREVDSTTAALATAKELARTAYFAAFFDGATLGATRLAEALVQNLPRDEEAAS